MLSEFTAPDCRQPVLISNTTNVRVKNLKDCECQANSQAFDSGGRLQGYSIC